MKAKILGNTYNELSKKYYSLDREPKALENAIHEILKVSSNNINHLISNDLLREIFEISICLGFSFWQNLSAFEQLSNSVEWQNKNHKLWKTLKTSNLLIGLGVTHLIKKECPVKAIQAREDYLLSGTIPWMSGFDYFQYFIIGFRIENRNVRALVKKQDILDSKDCTVDFIPLETMAATSSVSLKLKNFKIPSENIVAIAELGAKSKNYTSMYIYPETGIGHRALQECKKLQSNNETVHHLEQKLFSIEAAALKLGDEQKPERAIELQVERDECIRKCIRLLGLVEGGKAFTVDGLSSLLQAQSLLLDIYVQAPKVKELKTQKILDF